MRFYFDEHVHGAIAVGLRSRGIDVLLVQDDNRTGSDDQEVLDRAREIGRAVVTYDDDYLSLAARLHEDHQPFAPIIFLNPERITIGQAIDDLELIATAAEESELASLVTYLPWRK